MSPKQITHLVNKILRGFINKPNNVFTRELIKQALSENNIKDVEITSDNGILKVKTSYRSQFWEASIFIGVMKNQMVASGSFMNMNVPYRFPTEWFKTLSEDKDAIGKFLKNYLDLHTHSENSFLKLGRQYGTTFFHKNSEWWIQDNFNYDDGRLIKLATYLNLK